MLRPDGYVKVLDFGIAKLAEQRVPVTITDEEAVLDWSCRPSLGSIVGTVRYMSPEQARGDAGAISRAISGVLASSFTRC